jgi:hypothetical protein
MKSAIFKKGYNTQTVFGPEDLTQFITVALEGVQTHFQVI